MKTPVRAPAQPSHFQPTPAHQAIAALALLLGGCGINLGGDITVPGPYDATLRDSDDATDDSTVTDADDAADTDDSVDGSVAAPLPDNITFGDPSSTPITELGCTNEQYLTDIDVFARADGSQVAYGLCTTPDGRHTTLFHYQPDVADSLRVVTDAQIFDTASIAARPHLMAPYSTQERQWFASAELFNSSGSSNAGFAELLADEDALVTPIALPWVTADGTIVPVDQIDTNTAYKPTDIRGIAASADWVLMAAANTVPRCAWNTDVTDVTCTEAAHTGIAFAVHLSSTQAQAASNLRALPIGHLGASSVALIDVPQTDGTFRERIVVVADGATSQYPAPHDILAEGGMYLFDGATLDPIHAHAAVLPESAGFSGTLGVRGQRISTGDRRGNVYLINTAQAPAADNNPENAPAFAKYVLAAGSTDQISGTAFTPEGKFIVALNETAHTLFALRTNGSIFATVPGGTTPQPPAATTDALTQSADTNATHGIALYTGAQHFVLVNQGTSIVRVPIQAATP